MDAHRNLPKKRISMDKLKFLNELSKQLCDALPAGLHNLKKDFEKNSHLILQRTFSQFDLVTREEFDVQTKVLARSRQRIEMLEKKIHDLKKQLEGKS